MNATFLRGFVLMLGMVIYVSRDLPPMNDIENPKLDISTQIYTADGQKLGSLHNGQDRDYVPIDSMSPWVKKALVATEDVRFFDHSGIDKSQPSSTNAKVCPFPNVNLCWYVFQAWMIPACSNASA